MTPNFFLKRITLILLLFSGSPANAGFLDCFRYLGRTPILEKVHFNNDEQVWDFWLRMRHWQESEGGWPTLKIGWRRYLVFDTENERALLISHSTKFKKVVEFKDYPWEIVSAPISHFRIFFSGTFKKKFNLRFIPSLSHLVPKYPRKGEHLPAEMNRLFQTSPSFGWVVFSGTSVLSGW